MTTQKEYDKTLSKLATMLRRKPRTARAVAQALKCCKPVAYQRIHALEARGERVFTIPVREAKRGPKSVAYGISVA